MSRHSGSDPYLDPESGVLKNRLGLSDDATLEQAEAAFVATRSYELVLAPIEGGFDLAHLQAIHHYLFNDVYEWAGQLRTIDIGKGGNLFAHHAYISSAAAQIFLQLANDNNLAGLEAAAFSDRAAYYLGEINALHPFREGNGRTLREFISHLADANGYYIAWENVSQADMLAAAIESFKGRILSLAALIRSNLSGLDQDA